METVIFEKVRDYLIDYIGELAMAGRPVFDASGRCWRVPVLCKTPKAILPVGEFLLEEEGNFVAIPDKEQMVRILQAQLERLPFLVFGDKEELEKKGVQVVAL